MHYCEFKDCIEVAKNKIGFVGFEINTCNEHLDLMLDRSTELTNKLNLVRLNFLRVVQGKENQLI